MFAYIKGKVLSKGANFLVLENQGVGYKIFMSATALVGLKKGEEVSLHIHTHVREDMLALYGFLTQSELDLFELLISVSGVGPKVALSVLSGAPPDTIASAIATGDASVFTKVSGVGKKTAERIVIELKEKIGDDLGASGQGTADSLDALVALGYSKQEAREALKRIPKDLSDSGEIIKAALKLLGKNRS